MVTQLSALHTNMLSTVDTLISLHLPGQSGGGDLLPVRARSEQLSEVQNDVTIRARATCHKENLRTDYRIGFTDIVWRFRFI